MPRILQQRESRFTALPWASEHDLVPDALWDREHLARSLYPLNVPVDEGMELPRHLHRGLLRPGKTRLIVAFLAQLVQKNAIEHARDRRLMEHGFEGRVGLVVSVDHVLTQCMAASGVTLPSVNQRQC